MTSRWNKSVGISIHALREEGDQRLFDGLSEPFNISIHALREEGDLAELQNIMMRAISIHALREEGDVQHGQDFADVVISIHALREEGDPARPNLQIQDNNFYPRPPRGGRRDGLHHHLHRTNFYPRPPRGGRRMF